MGNAIKYKNFAFADFVSKQDAHNAIARKNELSIGGNVLSLRIVNKELTITAEMKQIYFNVAIVHKQQKQKQHRERKRDRDRDKRKEINIGIESEQEYKIRKRRERVHNQLENICTDLEQYQMKMNEKTKDMFGNDVSLQNLWKIGIDAYIEAYKNGIESDKKTHCKLLECYERQQKYENEIARYQSEIESVESQLKHLQNTFDD